MGQPAARLTDLHVCPAFNGPVAHVGGPILPPCCTTVKIGGQCAARVDDMVACVGHPAFIVEGSNSVSIAGMGAARMGDPTSHGGAIAPPCFPTVLIGG
jgi:uncharacterized Zn-binding protein involved in type VI secretion